MANGTLAASQIEMLSLSGTGIITITPPATNTNRAITLPDAAGAIVVSGTTPSLNGITFPATQSASADANTLDDYEEGTWTPSVGGTATYGAGNVGHYTKIGRLVVVSGVLAITSIGTGSVTLVGGLPFSVAVAGQGSIGYYDSISTSLVFIQPFVDTNATTSVKFRTLTAAATTMGAANLFQNNTRIDFTVTYFSA